MFTIECLKCDEVLKTKDAVRAAAFNNDHARIHRMETCIHSPGCDEWSHGIDCNNAYYGERAEPEESAR